MSYSVKFIVYTVDDPKVLQLVRRAVEVCGARVQEFTARTAADGEKEVYFDLRLSDTKTLGDIFRRVEAVKGAAIMAASEPKAIALPKRVEG
jgi:(p)ppGpp synthase/HD superfamily hydrolase